MKWMDQFNKPIWSSYSVKPQYSKLGYFPHIKYRIKRILPRKVHHKIMKETNYQFTFSVSSSESYPDLHITFYDETRTDTAFMGSPQSQDG